jgi:hypothetical protein
MWEALAFTCAMFIAVSPLMMLGVRVDQEERIKSWLLGVFWRLFFWRKR